MNFIQGDSEYKVGDRVHCRAQCYYNSNDNGTVIFIQNWSDFNQLHVVNDPVWYKKDIIYDDGSSVYFILMDSGSIWYRAPNFIRKIL